MFTPTEVRDLCGAAADALEQAQRERERDEMEARVEDMLNKWEECAKAAEARVTALTTALEKFGNHGWFCEHIRSGTCTCGLTAALLAPSPQPEATKPVPTDMVRCGKCGRPAWRHRDGECWPATEEQASGTEGEGGAK